MRIDFPIIVLCEELGITPGVVATGTGGRTAMLIYDNASTLRSSSRARAMATLA